ncbi:hypothetical protein EON77_19590, partial [bacterium]
MPSPRIPRLASAHLLAATVVGGLAGFAGLAGLASCARPLPCRVPVDGVDAPCVSPPCPPSPPSSGPGSRHVPHGAARVTRTTHGVLNAHGYTIYEPASPAPARAPLVVFFHGFFDAEPTGIDFFLRQLARSGFVVVYPTYGVAIAPGDWEANAAEAVSLAASELQAEGRVHADLARTGFVGHSVGALVALRVAKRD